MAFPSTLLGGDSFSYSYTDTAYPSDQWTLHLSLRGATSHNTVAASNLDGSFTIKLLPAVTAQFSPGKCSYVLYVDDGVDQYTVEQGTLDVALRADLITTSDVRSQYQRIVDAIDATLEGRATTDQAAYTVAGRSLSRIPVTELIVLRKHYAELALKADATANGRAKKTKLVVRPQ